MRGVKSAAAWPAQHRLFSVVLLALVVGLVCFVVIPPWWHYDEPGHFEYAWLAANSKTWPEVGQYDQGMRRAMARSMLKVGWYESRSFQLDLSSSTPIPIGVTQVGDKPGYYFLASLPLRLLRGADIIVQYYAARFVSLLLYLLIVVVAWYALGQVLAESHPLRWMTSAMLALLPAFVDAMVSVNNDVAAVLAASLFLWAALKIMVRGYSIWRVLFLTTALVACYLTKGTALFAFLLTPFALIFGLLRGRFAILVWGIAALGALGLAAVGLQWGAPAAWYATPVGVTPYQATVADGPLGQHAFELGNPQNGVSGALEQIVPPDQVKSLRGHPATLGAWMWSEADTIAPMPFVVFWTRNGTAISSAQSVVPATHRPAFVRAVVNVPSDAVNAIIYVKSLPTATSGDAVFLDGLALVPGGRSTSAPVFADAGSAHLIWDGERLQNLIRNGSAEQGALRVRQSFEARLSPLESSSGINLSLVVATLQDLKSVDWYYRSSTGTLFRTFWTSLGGDKTPVTGSLITYYLVLLTLLGIGGAILVLWVKRATLRWDIIGVLGLAVILPWVLAFARGLALFGEQQFLYPWSRYAFPGILPTTLLLGAGWLYLLQWAGSQLNFGSGTQSAIFFAVVGGISAFVIANAVQVFHPGWWSGWASAVPLFLVQGLIFLLLMGLRREPV